VKSFYEQLGVAPGGLKIVDGVEICERVDGVKRFSGYLQRSGMNSRSDARISTAQYSLDIPAPLCPKRVSIGHAETWASCT